MTLASHFSADLRLAQVIASPSAASGLDVRVGRSGAHRDWLQAAHPAVLLPAASATAAILYSPDSVWVAPRRQLRWVGGGRIAAGLGEEFVAMLEPEWAPLRSALHGTHLIDEYWLRFRYRGRGIEGVDLLAGGLVELHRIRIVKLEQGVILHETSVETWTIVAPQERPGPESRVLPG